jgi:hypothetical protein
MPPDWLETLVEPLVQPDVMIVTGSVLPLELETAAQRLFEAYGGLGRGSDRRVVNKDWFNRSVSAVPTWTLGATATPRFARPSSVTRRSVSWTRRWAPGCHSGVGEDTYLFYRVLKAGYTIVYTSRPPVSGISIAATSPRYGDRSSTTAKITWRII